MLIFYAPAIPAVVLAISELMILKYLYGTSVFLANYSSEVKTAYCLCS